jgi:hypothetical protein
MFSSVQTGVALQAQSTTHVTTVPPLLPLEM